MEPNSSRRPAHDYMYVILSALTYGLIFLYRSSFGPISDVLENEFQITSSGLGILSSSYYITSVLVQIPWGLFLQIYTSQLVIIITTFSLSISSFLFPLSTTSPNALIFGSIVRGFAGAMTPQIGIATMTLTGEKFGNNYVSTSMGILYLSGTVHGVFGNIIQAEMYETYAIWKPIYYVIAILSFIYGLILLVCLHKEKQINSDKLGSIFKKTTDFKTNKTNETNMSQHELNNMTLPLCKRLMKNSWQTVKMYSNWLLGIYAFCVSVILFGAMGLWFIPYVMVKYKYSRSLASIISGTTILSAGLASVGFGVCSRRFKKRKVFLIICSLLFLSFVIFMYVSNLHLVVVIVLNVMTGIGSGGIPIVSTLMREYNWYYGNAETATGLLATMILCSAFFAQYTIGVLLDLSYENRNVNGDSNREYTHVDYNFAFILVPICLGVSIIVALLLKETNGKNVEYEYQESVDTKTNRTNVIDQQYQL